VAAALAALFFGYYLVCAWSLPGGAGPDEEFSIRAVHFYFEHHRLAVLPDDEHLIEFSPTGSTRVLRPPLAFITAALVGGPLVDIVSNHVLLARLGSVVLCALAAGIAYLFLWIVLSSQALALTGALLLALLPQYAFIASYANDDSAALFSASLLFLSMALIWRHGVDLKRSALFGLAVGLLVIAKPTAWLLAPTAMVFVLAFVRAPLRKLATCAVVAALAFMVGGGWWVVHNVRQYGWQDPAARVVQAEAGERHRRIDDELLQSFRDRNIGYRALLLGNAEHFWQRTMHSTIGHLGWLELKLGPLQYLFYLFVIALALLYVPGRIVTLPMRRRGIGPGIYCAEDAWRLRFELLLLLSIVVQFAAFVWRNETTEVQLQGKYLLPAAPAAMALFMLCVRALIGSCRGWFRRRGISELSMPVSRIGAVVLVGLTGFALAAHVHAIVAYVVPYYDLAGYQDPPKVVSFESPRIWHPSGNPVILTSNVEDVEVADGEISFRTTGDDPWLILDGSICDMISGNSLLEIDMTASTAGTFSVYWDEGDGMTESRRVKAAFPPGRSGVFFGIGTRQCHQLRLDPPDGVARFTIHRVEVAGYTVSRPRN